jgi:hypothetical protein
LYRWSFWMRDAELDLGELVFDAVPHFVLRRLVRVPRNSHSWTKARFDWTLAARASCASCADFGGRSNFNSSPLSAVARITGRRSRSAAHKSSRVAVMAM